MDGRTKYFFFLPSKPCSSGPRKHRRIDTEPVVSMAWHKTVNTLPCKIEGVLCIDYGDERTETGWVMHRYHIGDDQSMKEGGLVVCKIYDKANQA